MPSRGDWHRGDKFPVSAGHPQDVRESPTGGYNYGIGLGVDKMNLKISYISEFMSLIRILKTSVFYYFMNLWNILIHVQIWLINPSQYAQGLPLRWLFL